MGRARWSIPVVSLLAVACSLSPSKRAEVDEQIALAVDRSLSCPVTSVSRCALDSPLLSREPSPTGVVPLEVGADALSARIHLIRAARARIDLQTYIFYDDPSSRLLLDELVRAARRGVEVRLLADALFSLPDRQRLARLAAAHANLRVRLYNPVLDRSRLTNPQFVFSVFCCFRSLNHRMHNKVLAIDGRAILMGGRNVADRYFDLDTRMVFRDFEVIVVGDVSDRIVRDFETYWNAAHTLPAVYTVDVAGRILAADGLEDWKPYPLPDRLVRLRQRASDPDWVRSALVDAMVAVETVEYFSDPPGKPYISESVRGRDVTRHIHDEILAARNEIWLQSPYLVVSRRFRDVLDQRPPEVALRISTNSLASTDAYPVYAVGRRQRHRLLEEPGVEIFEFKPYPESRHELVPRYRRLVREKARGVVSPLLGDSLTVTEDHPGPRIGLHAKRLVIDGLTTVITSHNFDPRSEHFNTENALVIRDARFARRMIEQLRRDTAAGNAWVVAPRPADSLPGAVNATVAGWSRALPVLDFWPWWHDQAYERPAEEDMPAWWEENFHDVHEPVGGYPEVIFGRRLIFTSILARMFGFLLPIM